MQGIYGSVFWLVLLFTFMYFMLIRPQKRDRKLRQAMLDNLKVNDKIVTLGGFYGKIIKLDEETMKLEIAENLCVKLQRTGVNFVVDEKTKN